MKNEDRNVNVTISMVSGAVLDADKFSDKCNVNGILCHIHYNALSNFKREISQHVECVICEKSSSKRFISIVKENVDIFTKYLTLELQHDTDVDTKEKIFCCSLCYKNFNAFCRSDAGEDLKYQTSQYMCEQVHKFKFDESVNQENIDLYTFEQIKDIVLESFLKEESLLLPNIYEKFKQYLYINIAKFEYVISETDLKKLQHSNKWIFKMLKIRFSKCLQVFVPKRKQDGRLIYRNGINFINCLHSLTVKNNQLTSEKNDISEQLIEKNSTIIAMKNKITPKHEILSEALQILRSFVKSYTTGKTANSCLPDIHAFDAKHEINQIPPVLWNFLYRLSATDKEDKEFVKTVASWDHHYIETPFNVNRAFPRLYMCSCIFNCQNAQCVQPLHLLVTDICDKFSNASSTFLSINARLGLGVSKDSLRRYITNRCRQLEQQQRFLTSNSFVVASFDNLDKNQSYSVVGVGKDKSCFHGTTIQAVTPCPSLFTSISSSESCGTDLDDSAVPLLVNGISSEANIITSDIKSSSCEVDLISSAVAIVDKVSTCTALSRDRSLTCDFIQSIVNPDDKIGPSRSGQGNQFENLTASFLDVTPREAASFTEFTDLVHRYGFTKCLLHDKQIQIPGIKTFLSIPSEKTEKSDFTSVAVLDDTIY
ncbi:unnamed protein product [Mytilus edulis]|uniref:Uncharacterized protein n=1 Tax=Mytilus edulis TaxID=6550 RepID=A0A8S3SFM7_MYTED|nr:unnamed protein product [Mytilus edulis]